MEPRTFGRRNFEGIPKMVCETPSKNQILKPQSEDIQWAASSNQTISTTGPSVGKPCEVGVSGISISDAAYERLKRLLNSRPSKEEGLRVAVQGGGCAGMAYKLTWDVCPKEKDRIFARGEVRVFVDPKSYLFLIGSMIDYQEELLQSGFKISNPRAKATCGCGESFAV